MPQQTHIFESLPICVLRLDSVGKCTYANSLFLKTLDITFAEIENDKWHHIFNQSDRNRILEYVQDTSEERAPLVFDAEIIFAKSTRWTQVRAQKIAQSDGTILLFVDISEVKNQAGLIFENEEKFRGAFENVSAGMAIVSLDGILLKVNNALCKMLGYERSQIEGITLQSLTHPDDIVADKENIKRILAGDMTHYQMEKRYLHKDASLVWAILSVDLVADNTGKPQFFISHIQDISQLKQTSLELAQKITELSNQVKETQKFKLAVDFASDHIIISDPEGVVVYANDAVEHVTGYKPAEALGKKAGSLWSVPMPTEYYKNMWHTIKDKKETFQGEITNRRKNGENYIAHLTISPVLDENRNVVFFLGIERDISREKSIDQAKSEFVSFASHQLRTPLTSVKWYTEMLLSGDAGEVSAEQQKYLREIYVGSKRMVSLVTALLNVSRIEMGTFSVEPEETNVSEVMKTVLDELKLQINEKQLHVTSEVETLGTVLTDQKLIRIVFQNIFTNAIKYTPAEGKIAVSLRKAEKGMVINEKNIPTAAWVVTVTDTGYGIPAYQKDKIFTKLFRADNVRAKDTTGTGLGLYITKSIITESGGEIWFNSVENQGSAFSFWLPLQGMNKRSGSRSLEENHES